MAMTRKRFAELRNAYYAEMIRRPEQERRNLLALHPSPRDGGEWEIMWKNTMASIREMEQDYKILQVISALQEPTEQDFERAIEIFKKHGIINRDCSL
jgi:hypothetical protein